MPVFRNILLALVMIPLLTGCQWSVEVTRTPATMTPNALQLLPTYDVSPPPPPPPDFDPDAPSANAVIGSVLEITPEHLIVTTTLASTYTIHLVPQTAIWNGGWNPDRAIEVGDEVSVSGQVDHQAHTAIAEKIWVNLVSLAGTLASPVTYTPAGNLTFTLSDPRYGDFLIEVASGQKIFSEDVGKELTPDAIQWDIVRYVDVVGLKRKNGTVLADSVSVSSQ